MPLKRCKRCNARFDENVESCDCPDGPQFGVDDVSDAYYNADSDD